MVFFDQVNAALLYIRNFFPKVVLTQKNWIVVEMYKKN